MDHQWVVHKFGGTSVGNSPSMLKCVDIIRPQTLQSQVAVIVSAMGGKPKVTDMLLDAVHAAAASRFEDVDSLLMGIETKHKQCIHEILPSNVDIGQEIMRTIFSDIKDIRDLLKAVSLMRVAHSQILELVSGYGEVRILYVNP